MHGKEKTHDNAVHSAGYASHCDNPRDVRVHLGYGGGSFSFADCRKAGAPTHHAPKGTALISPWLKPGVLRAGLIRKDAPMFFIARFARWVHKRRKDRLWCEFREWYHIHEQAKSLHFISCPYCHTPAQRETASFCSQCGASLPTVLPLPTRGAKRLSPGPGASVAQTSPPPLPTKGQYTTELIPLTGERPLHAYLRTKHHSLETADVPTRKFRTVRLDQIV